MEAVAGTANSRFITKAQRHEGNSFFGRAAQGTCLAKINGNFAKF